MNYEAGQQIPVELKISGIGEGDNCLLYVPENYDNNNNDLYPLIIFLHGIGEGTVAAQTRQGLPRVIAQGKPPYANIEGKRQEFIVAALVPEFFEGWISDSIKDLKNNLRIDPDRIYITGLSAGARTTADYLSHTSENLEPIHAAVPMSYTLTVQELLSGIWMKDWNGFKGKGLWAFTGASDAHTEVATEMVKRVNEAGGSGRLTVYPGGHCCWPTYYDPEYRENIEGKMMNIYEWMLLFTGEEVADPVTAPKEGSSGIPPAEKLIQPYAIIRGGKHDDNKGITTTESSVVLDASPSTGTIDNWYWGQLSGPDCHISQDDSSKATITGLHEGTYVFFLTVSAKEIGWPSTDKVTVVINAKAPSLVTIESIDVNYSNGNKENYDGDIETLRIVYKDGTSKIITK